MKSIHIIRFAPVFAFALSLAACSGGTSSILFTPADGGPDAGESATNAEGGTSGDPSTTGGNSGHEGDTETTEAGAGSGTGGGAGYGAAYSNGGGGSTNGNGGGGSTNASGGSCGVALGTGNAMCDCCVAVACTPDDTQCANDAPCVAAIACVKQCNGYASCVQDCEFENPSSQAELFLSCVQFSCMSSCGGFYGEL